MSITGGPAFLRAVDPPAPATPLDPADVLLRRYLDASVATATTASGALVTLRGAVRVGRRWVPFRAVEAVTPGHGSTRIARLGPLVAVDDVAVPGEVVHRVRVAGHALREDRGDDVARRAVGELALATVWVPPALAGRPDVRRTVAGPSSLHVSVPSVPSAPGAVRPGGPLRGAGVTLRLHPRGLPLAVRVAHWGDPRGGRRPDWLPFGGPVLEHRTWAGVTVPSTGVLGWFPGTGRWTEVLRWQLTGWEPLGGSPAVA